MTSLVCLVSPQVFPRLLWRAASVNVDARTAAVIPTSSRSTPRGPQPAPTDACVQQGADLVHARACSLRLRVSAFLQQPKKKMCGNVKFFGANISMIGNKFGSTSLNTRRCLANHPSIEWVSLLWPYNQGRKESAQTHTAKVVPTQQGEQCEGRPRDRRFRRTAGQ